MADTPTNVATINAEDVLPVRSRVSWGAIFAGAMVALALYFLLTLLAAAIGLSVADRVRAETIGVGAAVCGVFSAMVSLFVGGYVTSQCSVGENKFEAALYGVILWGVLFGMLMWLMAVGVRAGFTAMVSVAYAARDASDLIGAAGWEEMAKRAKVPQERIDEWRKEADEAASKAGSTVEDPAKRKQALDEASQAATRVTWWAFFGTLLSMLASVAGALAGTGPRFRIVATPYLRPARPGEATQHRHTVSV